MFAIYFLIKDNMLKISSWSINYVREILNFSVPLLPHAFGMFLLSTVDRAVINEYMGLASAGVYMVAVQLSSSMSIVFDAINKAYTPWLFNKLSLNIIEDNKKIVKLTYIYITCVFFISLTSFFIGPMVVNFVAGTGYEEASYIIGWLCLGQAFSGMYLMVTNYVFYAKKTGQLSIVTLSSGLIHVTLLLLLVKDYGLQGAAVSFTISKCIQFILTWLLAMKVQHMPWFDFYKKIS